MVRPGALLGVLHLDETGCSVEAQVRAMAAAAVASDASRLYLAITGAGVDTSPGCTLALISALGRVFDTLSQSQPRLYTLPLVPFTGWSAGAIAALQDVAAVLPGPAAAAAAVAAAAAAASSAGTGTVEAALGGAGSGDTPSAASTAAEPSAQGTAASAAAAGAAAVAASTALPAEASARASALAGALGPAWSAPGPHPTPQDAPQADRSSCSSGEPHEAGSAGPGHAAAGAGPAPSTGAGVQSHARVAMGGTFDRLHSGHMLLLAAAGLVATSVVYVGVTDAALLGKKAHRELLQGFEEREAAAADYLRALRPGLRVQTGALRDASEPTAAETDPSMGAIVVSHETMPGAVAINAGRSRRGFAPLEYVVVPLVGVRGDHKLSSTDLRAADAAKGRGDAVQTHA